MAVFSQETRILETEGKNAIIDTLLHCFEKHYVLPGEVVLLKDSLLRKNEQGGYDEIKDKAVFLSALSSDIRAYTNDKHIRINYIPHSNRKRGQHSHSILAPSLTEREALNFFFRKIEWLNGNIGYFRFDVFADTAIAGKKAAAAMEFFSNCDAVIIDLRYNGGGEGTMVRYLSGYFLKEPTLLLTMHFTRQDSVFESWSYPIDHTQYPKDQELYILTSYMTASAAEGFTYGLKNLGRATVIGETTSGAAHWVDYFFYPTLNMEIKLPVARPMNPVTLTNWEKTGIEPDIAVPEYSALNRAHLMALESARSRAADSMQIRDLDWHIAIAREKLKNEVVYGPDLAEYAGEFEMLTFLNKNGHLFWHQGKDTEYILVPLSRDHFMFHDTDDYIVKFIRDKENRIKGFEFLVKFRKQNTYYDKTG
jgi:hypothetical protein